MAKPIYKLWVEKVNEAYYNLSEEDQEDFYAKVMGALESCGGRNVLICQTTWSSGQWGWFSVDEFPDIDALHAYEADLEEMNYYRYVECMTFLGTEYEETT